LIHKDYYQFGKGSGFEKDESSFENAHSVVAIGPAKISL
jgi:hypothetical protein